jgi:hypothetical protein
LAEAPGIRRHNAAEQTRMRAFHSA